MKLWEAILDLLYPPRCAFCHRLLRQKGEGVCPDCIQKLPRTGALAAQDSFRHIERCVSPLFYENTVRASLHRYKFAQCRGYAGIYAGFVVKCIDENKFSCDSITWVPVSRRRLRRRGYDQAELLAREIAARLGLPCLRMLDKVRDNPPQSRAGKAKERRENVKGVYRCADPSRVSGRLVLLVDDIVTTGATLSEGAKVLKEAGAASVYAATLARRRE